MFIERLMTRGMCRAGILACFLFGGVAVRAQGTGDPAAGSLSQPTPQEWARLRALVDALVTEEGTRKVFSSQSNLADSFSSEEHFATFVAPWRTRLVPLPLTRQDASAVDVDIRRTAEGITACLMTFHHEEPVNAITIMRTLWRDDHLLKVIFMKGFANIRLSSPHRNRMDEEDFLRYQDGGRRTPVRPGGRR